MAEQEGDGGNGALSDAPLPDAPMDERPMAAAQEAETERERARADSRETREAEDANGGDSVGAVHDATSGADGAPASAEDTAAEERRKRRERRRGLAWDKDAQGNAVAPAPLLAVASAHVPGAALGALAPLAVPAPAPSPLQQQATLTRRARRLHVGSLPPGISIQLLRDLFNSSLLSAGLTIGGAPDVINDVQMGGEGKFAFIEFRSVREATSALALDGLDLLGRKIRVQRPNDFVVPPLELHAVIIPAGMSAREPQAAHAPLGVLPGAFPGVVPGAMPGGIHAAMAGFGVGVPAYALGGALHPPLPPLPPASVASALNAQALAHAATNNPMQAQLTAHQISRKARRLHVGNLPQGMGITPAMLKQFFNATLMATGLVDPSKPGEPVIDVTINTAGKFAFAEFRCIAEATSALTLNNVELAGRQLRVERPRDYTPVATSVLPDLERAGVVGETPICNMQQIAEHCASGGVPVPLAPTALPGAPYAAPSTALSPGFPAASSVPAAPALVVDASKRVLGLSSMVTDVELNDEEEVRDILDDARTECAKHGPVESLLLLQRGVEVDLAAGLPAADKVIFVKFGSADAAAGAARVLHGKKFDGRLVAASFHSDEQFDALGALPHHAA